jgi:hypothetical protein
MDEKPRFQVSSLFYHDTGALDRSPLARHGVRFLVALFIFPAACLSGTLEPDDTAGAGGQGAEVASPGGQGAPAGGAPQGLGGAGGGLQEASNQDAGADAQQAMGGTGGAPDPADRCAYRGGGGGADYIYCHTVTVRFEPPLDARLKVLLTSDVDARGMMFNPFCQASSCLIESAVFTLTPANTKVEPGTFPTRFTIKVTDGDTVVGERTFTDLAYACNKRTSDDWCWEAAVVTFRRP